MPSKSAASAPVYAVYTEGVVNTAVYEGVDDASNNSNETDGDYSLFNNAPAVRGGSTVQIVDASDV
jgi:hypothetical protein